MTVLTLSAPERDLLRLWCHQNSKSVFPFNTSTHSHFRMGSNTSKEDANAAVEQPKEEDDEPDEW